jgi:hypothetical protein
MLVLLQFKLINLIKGSSLVEFGRLPCGNLGSLTGCIQDGSSPTSTKPRCASCLLPTVFLSSIQAIKGVNTPKLPPDTPNRGLLEQSWVNLSATVYSRDGRVIDFEIAIAPTSEGQTYAMLRAVLN